MPRVSPKHALTEQELDFCKKLAAGLTAAESYRRAYPDELISSRTGKHMDAKEVSRQGNQLLKQDHIQAYLKEIGRSTGDTARQVLTDQALFGKDGEARRAAERILEQEERLTEKDAVMRWIEIMCEAGAEIEVPLPAKCASCGSPVVVSVPMEEMFGGKV